MPLYRRIARRGFSNYPFKKRWVVVNLLDIDRVYEAGETVDLSSLVKKGLVKRSVELVKILADGEISKKLSFEGLKLSAAAAAKVRSAGGSIAGGSTAETQASVTAESTEDSGEEG
jgi:large subunit ribosomal protein L15